MKRELFSHKSDILETRGELNYMEDNRLALLSQVAHMYYDLQMSQPEIAEKLYYSRSKVSRMLDKAVNLGIVDIKVKRYVSRIPAMEKKMKSTFQLLQPIVVSNYGEWGDEDSHEALTNYAAKYISNQIEGSCVLGITGSQEITRVVKKLSRIHDCDLQVVQVMGAAIGVYESNALMDYFARIYGATSHFLHTPIFVNDLYVKNTLLGDPSVSKAMQLMSHCNLILMGIGSFDVNGDMPAWDGYMTSSHRKEMQRLNAVGSICSQFFDINGNYIACEWNKKCIAISWENIKKADLRIAVASGQSKTEAVLGALRGHLVDVLITDITTASQIMELEQKLKTKATK